MKRATAALLLACAVAAPLAARAEEAPPDPCEVPDRILTIDAALPRAQDRMKRGQGLSILVLNTATPRPERAAASYPAVMEQTLAARLPGQKVSVSVRGAPGATAQEMVPVMANALAAQPASLLVWQVGTVDAMRNISPDSFGAALASGIALAHQRGTDVIVMDMQYSPQTTQLITFQPYLDYVEWVSQNNEVFHFPRYEMMRYWYEEGRVDYDPNPKEAKLQDFTFVHRCIGRRLGESVAVMLDRAAEAAQ